MLATRALVALGIFVALGPLITRDTSLALEALVERETLVSEKAIVGGEGGFASGGMLVCERLVDGKW